MKDKSENIHKSYQKQEKSQTLTNENRSANKLAKSGDSKKTAGTAEKNTSKNKAAPKKKAKEYDDREDEGQGVGSRDEEQGHEIRPSRKCTDVQIIAKSSYGPIQEMPTVQERLLEISIDNAIESLGMGPFQRRILIAAGLCFAADSMEILLLSFLAVALQSKWNLTEDQTASITSSVFAGAVIGSLVLGPLANRIGRKPVFTLTAAIICVFGFFTAAANSFPALLLCRFLVGLGVGGLTVPFDTLAEFVPASHRGANVLAIEYFWTGGTLMVPVLAYFSLSEGDDAHQNGWRIFVVLCGLPCLASTVLGIFYVPESPRWLMTKGKHGKALGILRLAAARNGKDPMELFPENTHLVDDEAAEENNNFCDLLAPQWRRTTLLLWGTWAGLAFTYFGAIIVVTMVFASANNDGLDQDDAESYSFDYWAIFTSASAEVAGTTLIIFLVDRIGRIPSQALSYLTGGCSLLILCLLASQEDASRSHLIVFSFLARMFFMSANCATWISTAEILTTETRTTGHSAANAVARLSASFSPYLLTNATPYPVIGGVMFAISLSTATCVWNLPETKGLHMGAAAQNPKPVDSAIDASPEKQSSFSAIKTSYL